MNHKKKTALEAKLTPLQRKAIFVLIENELLPKNQQKGKGVIAEELGVSGKTLWKWSTQNEAFIDYKNMIADDFLSSKRNAVYAQLLNLIEAQGSVKAIDLYLRRFGLLTDKTIVEQDTSNGSRSNEDLERELAELEKSVAEANSLLADSDEE